MDVTDTYAEQLRPDPSSPSGLATVYQGQLEPVIPIPETFRQNNPGSGTPDNLTVVPPGGAIPPATLIVPRRNNGPIIQLDQAAGTALSVQYTGFSATRELDTFLIWDDARNLDDFRRGLELFDVGGQNWAYADVEGNIAYFTSAELPLREDLQAGTVNGLPPFFIRNGTGGNEWLPVQQPPARPGHPLRDPAVRRDAAAPQPAGRLLRQRQQRPGRHHPGQRPAEPGAARRRHLLPQQRLRRHPRRAHHRAASGPSWPAPARCRSPTCSASRPTRPWSTPSSSSPTWSGRWPGGRWTATRPCAALARDPGRGRGGRPPGPVEPAHPDRHRRGLRRRRHRRPAPAPDPPGAGQQRRRHHLRGLAQPGHQGRHRRPAGPLRACRCPTASGP